MIYIKLQNKSLNLQTDTEVLEHVYIEILNKIKK